MRKKLILLTVLAAFGLTLTACGKEETGLAQSSSGQPEVGSTQEITSSLPETEAASTIDEMGSVAEEKNQNNEDLTALAPEVLTAFAEDIKMCVADKDLEGLAGLTAYPVYVGVGEGIIAETKDDFMAIGADKIFTEDMVKAMADVKTDNLQTSMAGVTLGDAGPSITFNMVNGNLGIQGINY